MARGVLTSLGIFVCAAGAASPAASDETPPASSGQTQAAPAGKPAASSGGMTIYIDPQTGAIRDTPAPGTTPLSLSPRERETASTSDQGLVPVPSPVPGGGVQVDLQGRFQSPLIGTIGADGKLRMEHLGEAPGSHSDK